MKKEKKPIENLTAGILVFSDTRSEKEDISGKLIEEFLMNYKFSINHYLVIKDDPDAIVESLIKICDAGVDLLITTGGTGFSPRDNAPEATNSVIERETPGISEAIRANGLNQTRFSMLSRGVSGIRGKTLIVNLPGNPKAINASLEYVIEPLIHGIGLAREDVGQHMNS